MPMLDPTMRILGWYFRGIEAGVGYLEIEVELTQRNKDSWSSFEVFIFIFCFIDFGANA